MLKTLSRTLTSSKGQASLGILGYFLFLSWFSFNAFRHFVAGYDLTIFYQAITGYSRLSSPESNLLYLGQGQSVNILGEHFQPIIAILAPLVWIWPDPRVLLLAQAALVCISLWPIWTFTRRRFGHHYSLVVMACYAVSWPIASMVGFDFHEIAFAVPLLAWMVESLDRKNYWWVVVLSCLLLLVREDLGFVAITVAILLALERQFKHALLVSLAAAVSLVFAFFWVIPHFSPTANVRLFTYSKLGSTPLAAIEEIFHKPWLVLQEAFRPTIKAFTFLLLILPSALACLGSRYVLIGVPLIFEYLLNDRPILWVTSFHYWAPLAPITTLAAVDAIGKLKLTNGKKVFLEKLWLIYISIFAIAGLSFLPFSYKFGWFDSAFYRSSPQNESIEKAIEIIPQGVCVEADNHVLPHLVADRKVFSLAGSDEQANWIVLIGDRTGDLTAVDPRKYEKTKLANGYKRILDERNVVVLYRGHNGSTGCR